MVKVEPIVFGQFSRQDLGVVDHVVWDFGVGQNQGHSIVPWLFALGTVVVPTADGLDTGNFFFEGDETV